MLGPDRNLRRLLDERQLEYERTLSDLRGEIAAVRQLAIEGLTGYFRSHPLPSERLAQANEVIAADHLAKNKPLKPFHVAYEVTSGAK